MMHIHQRIAELWEKKNSDAGLTADERSEFAMCLDLNVTYAWKMARLENLSYVAYSTGDMDWLHDICAEIDKLEEEYSKNFRVLKERRASKK